MDMRQDKPSILIIGDDEQVRGLLTETLSDRFFCTSVDSAEKALAVLANGDSLVVSEPGISGLELVPRISQMAPDTAVIMIRGQQAIKSAIEAMRLSACDYITKPTQENSATADPENEEWPSLAQVEGRYVARVLGKTRGNKQAASRVLGVDRKTLNRMIVRHKIAFSKNNGHG